MADSSSRFRRPCLRTLAFLLIAAHPPAWSADRPPAESGVSAPLEPAAAPANPVLPGATEPAGTMEPPGASELAGAMEPPVAAEPAGTTALSELPEPVERPRATELPGLTIDAAASTDVSAQGADGILAPTLERLDPSPVRAWSVPPPDMLPPPPPAAASAAALPPPPSAAAPAAASPPRPAVPDPRLHEGLGWDFCGPRPGATGIGIRPTPAAGDRPVDFVADDLDYDRNADVVRLWGEVDVRQGEQRLTADRAAFDRPNDRVRAAGRVLMDSPGLRLAGETAEYHPKTHRGIIERVQYRLSGEANLRGTAEQAWLDSETLSRYRDIRYTSCPPGRNDWSLAARDLELDRASGRGKARHARIELGGVPVLYSPVLSFPIDSRRRSGLLIPTVGSSDETGLDITIPYYWNIAPNLDATLMPRYMSKRGFMLGTEFRYLNAFQSLEVNTEILPSDRAAPDEGMRGALRIEQQGRLGARWTTGLDIAAVSDDRYLQDFGNHLEVTSLRNLTQRADLWHGGEGWRFLARIQQFQTVDASLAPVDRPYGQLPHLAFDLDRRALPGLDGAPLQYGFASQYDYFDHNAKVHGSRLVAVPEVRLPLKRAHGSLTPRARLFYTTYDLAGQAENLAARQTYLIPSLDLDGRLILERETRWFGATALQTLEPRLYYVFTGFEDQSQAPIFDTAALDFSFASLFRPNRFTGYDRIGDENRLTLGLTSRTLDYGSGRELFRASLGQIQYFDERRVQLDNGAPVEASRSSIAGEVAAHPHPDWSVRASVQWNPDEDEAAERWEKRVLQLRYAPGDERLLNLAYRFNLGTRPDEGYEDTDLSFRMPVGSGVSLVGRWLYSLLNEDTVEAFAGVEFGRCCWRLRLLAQHLKRERDSDGSTSVMLQLELAGLGAFGNRIDKRLERGIYGYHSD